MRMNSFVPWMPTHDYLRILGITRASQGRPACESPFLAAFAAPTVRDSEVLAALHVMMDL